MRSTNMELKRSSQIVYVPPSVASPMRLFGADTCYQDEAGADARHLSEKVMPELGEEGGTPTARISAEGELIGTQADGATNNPRKPRACEQIGGWIGANH